MKRKKYYFLEKFIVLFIIGIFLGLLLKFLTNYKLIEATITQISEKIEQFLGLIIFLNLTLALGSFILTFIATWIQISQYLRRDQN